MSKRTPDKPLEGSQTLENLKIAFAGEAQANRRYLYFADMADEEGQTEAANLFRDISKGETRHAFGHFDWLDMDPVTSMPVGQAHQNLESAIAGETYEYSEMYPGFAQTAEAEGYADIAKWFQAMAKAERVHAGRFQKLLDGLEG